MNNKPFCCIVCAGSFNKLDFSPPDDAYIIAADGGFDHLKSLGRLPDLLLGDFDSLANMPDMPPEKVIKLVPEKDDTDTLYAVKHALSLGYDRFLFYGALGGERTDHTLANIQTLSYIANHGGQGFIINDGTVITAFTNKSIRLKSHLKGFISVFAASTNACSVTEKGLKYTLDGYTLSYDTPLGVSNEFIGEEAFIEVENGTLTVVYTGKYTDCIF